MGMMYGNGSFKGGIDAAVLAYIGDSTLTTSADNLGDAINEHEEDISEIKSNLTELETDIADKNIETITLISSTTTGYSSNGFFISMHNGLSIIDAHIRTSSSKSSWTKVGELPSGYNKPKTDIFYPALTWGSGSSTRLDVAIRTNGNIELRSGANSGDYYLHIVW